MIKTYKLYKKNQWIGEAVIFPSGSASYHLWQNIRQTKYSTLTKLEKQYNLVVWSK